jgi:dTDP-4-amino-4,6-dideoxygalactose transaminase
MSVPFLDLARINSEYLSEFASVFEEFMVGGRYVLGCQVEKFEAEFSQYCGASRCIGVGSGLDALTLVLKSWKELGHLLEDDEVIVPSNTYIASVLAIKEAGLTPVLAEPNEDTFTIDVRRIESVLTPRSRVVMPVHLYGKLAPMQEIMDFCEGNKLLVLEDAAQAHGASYGGKRAGNFGHAAAFSFYPGKNLGALGDAGAITTSDNELAEVLRAIRNYGSKEKYHHIYQGTNSRIDELQAGLLRKKLRNLDRDNKRRQRIAIEYAKRINNEHIKLPLFDALDNLTTDHVFHLFVIRCNYRDDLQRFLAKNSIETLIHYPISIRNQPCFDGSFVKNEKESNPLEKTLLSLPISPVMTAFCNRFRPE